jgi:hypothetical protein
MLWLAEQFPDFGIVSPLTTQLSWMHFGRKAPTALRISTDTVVIEPLGSRPLYGEIQTVCVALIGHRVDFLHKYPLGARD